MGESGNTGNDKCGSCIYQRRVLNVQPGSAILDIPCGTGRHSIALARDGYQLTAIDISKEFIDELKEKVEAQHLTFGGNRRKHFISATNRLF